MIIQDDYIDNRINSMADCCGESVFSLGSLTKENWQDTLSRVKLNWNASLLADNSRFKMFDGLSRVLYLEIDPEIIHIATSKAKKGLSNALGSFIGITIDEIVVSGALDVDDHAESALNTQIGGDHYKNLKIQPVQYIYANNIPFIEGCIIKYVTRWKNKGGIKDLEKIIHFTKLLIEMEK